MILIGKFDGKAALYLKKNIYICKCVTRERLNFLETFIFTIAASLRITPFHDLV
jgi:hypothetical protein